MFVNFWLPIISIIVSIGTLVYTIFSNRTKYELTYQRYNDILNWHATTVSILISLKSLCDRKSGTDEKISF